MDIEHRKDVWLEIENYQHSETRSSVPKRDGVPAVDIQRRKKGFMVGRMQKILYRR